MDIKSEFRQDLVSGEWVLVSSSRAKRPILSGEGRPVRKKNLPENRCPFEDPQKNGNPAPILWYPAPGTPPEKKDDLSSWFLQIIPNKYPAVAPGFLCEDKNEKGPFRYMEGGGFHEVIITRDHSRTFTEMTDEELFLAMSAYRERFLALQREKCLAYIFIFHNHGPSAGASIAHPHSQLIALPIIPPDVSRSLSGSQRFWKKEGKCVHCVMIDWEKKEKARLIFENEYFIVVSPYASRVAYEVRLFPKEHFSSFEEISDTMLSFLALALKNTLLKIKKSLKDPDYNFFIHTAPLDKSESEHYHWHLEILPKTGQWAGLELGTGIELVGVFPEEAAEILRNSEV